VTTLIVIVVVNLVLDRMVLSRLEKFSTALQDFGQDQQPPHYVDNQPDEIGHLSTAFHWMARQIEARSLENRILSENLQRQSEARGELLGRLITAQEDERARLARELHDEMGQSLSGLSLQVEVLQKYIKEDPVLAKEYLRQIQGVIRDTTDCMYDLILALRPSLLDDLGLVAALRAHAERCFTGKGISYDFNAGELDGRLPPEIETALYRTFQEAISNIIRHSKATRVQIKLSQVDHHFEGEIIDNGQGFDLKSIPDRAGSRGLGLLGMRERITQCGGRIDITSSLDSGTKISILIPIREV
jgi:signal transduction histidine kinase